MLQSRLVVEMFSVGVTVLGLGTTAVYGQTYPYKPIRIVTSGAGGGSDFDSRQIAQGITGPLGQPVIVENHQGTAPEIVSRALPDGYSLLVNGQFQWVLPLLQKTPYNVADFAPISLIETSPGFVVVSPSLPVTSIKELIALAKAKPGELNYASTAIGSGPHLSAELFKSMAGVNIVHVPYKGAAPAMAAVIGGEAQMTITSGAATVLAQVKSGKLRALAVTSAQPTTLFPGLPTVAASGLPGYEAVSMTAIFAPVKTPSAIINRLNQEIVRFLHRPDVKETFFKVGVDVVGSSPEQLALIIKSDMAKMSKVIKDAGIRAE